MCSFKCMGIKVVGFFLFVCLIFLNQWGKNLHFGGHKNSEALVLICLGEAQFYAKHQYFLVFGTDLSDQYHSLERLLSTNQI